MRPQARKTGIVIQDVNDELLVYDLQRDQAHCLNKVTSFVWRHADGATDAAQLVELARQEGIDGVDETVVDAAFVSLSGANLLVESPDADLSRRQMIRQVAAIGGVAATVAITSIVAPTPAEAKTAPPSCGQDCQGNQNQQ